LPSGHFMAKATLTFDLDDADDRMAHLRCVSSLDMALILWHLRMNFIRELEHSLRSYKPKGDIQFDSDHIDAFIEMLQDKMNELFDDNDVNIGELIN